jgi:hypothetical protein
MTAVTDELPSWDEVKGPLVHSPDKGLLLGNGASQAIWTRFSYRSLYEIACDPHQPHPLTPVDQAFFAHMNTTNFEAVLSALATTKMVCGHLNKEFGDVQDRYDSIRLALIGAVQSVHIQFDRIPEETKRLLAAYLHHHRYIYSTNYDLLVYWSIMTHPEYFKDFLWGHEQSFESSDSQEWDDPATKVLYLHGALHLYHNVEGRTKKKVYLEGENRDLLSQFDVAGDWIPLFISEGTSADKLRSIRRNEYLNFALWKFAYHRGPLVVFGHSLSQEYDKHIIDAIANWPAYDKWRFELDSKRGRYIAVSLYPAIGPEQIIAEKNRLTSLLKPHNVEFFDSTTYPLSRFRIEPA